MTITLELPPDVDAQLQAEATKRGLSKEEYALLKLGRPEMEPVHTPTAGEAILHLTQELYGDMPAAERSQLPSDYAINHDYYIHDGAKVQE